MRKGYRYGFYMALALAAATPLAAHATAASSGLDTPSGVTSLPFSIAGAQVMTLTSNGTETGLGIGTTTVDGGLQISTLGAKWTSNGWYKGIRLDDGRTLELGGGAAIRYGIGESGNNLYFFSTATETATAPALYFMEVKYDSSNPSAVEDITMGGTVTAAAFFQSSDARLKTNIKTDKGLDIVDKLRGVSFDWKNGTGHSNGVLAQDVQKVMPSAVRAAPDGHLTVDYSQLIGPMIESIKELKTENDQLRAEIEQQ